MVESDWSGWEGGLHGRRASCGTAILDRRIISHLIALQAAISHPAMCLPCVLAGLGCHLLSPWPSWLSRRRPLLRHALLCVTPQRILQRPSISHNFFPSGFTCGSLSSRFRLHPIVDGQTQLPNIKYDTTYGGRRTSLQLLCRNATPA